MQSWDSPHSFLSLSCHNWRSSGMISLIQFTAYSDSTHLPFLTDSYHFLKFSNSLHFCSTVVTFSSHCCSSIQKPFAAFLPFLQHEAVFSSFSLSGHLQTSEPQSHFNNAIHPASETTIGMQEQIMHTTPNHALTAQFTFRSNNETSNNF